jgi:hypothetical protein
MALNDHPRFRFLILQLLLIGGLLLGLLWRPRMAIRSFLCVRRCLRLFWHWWLVLRGRRNCVLFPKELRLIRHHLSQSVLEHFVPHLERRLHPQVHLLDDLRALLCEGQVL